MRVTPSQDSGPRAEEDVLSLKWGDSRKFSQKRQFGAEF